MINTRFVIGLLGATLLLSLLGIIVLAIAKPGAPPDVLQNVTIGALTALSALLVPPRGASPDLNRRADEGD